MRNSLFGSYTASADESDYVFQDCTDKWKTIKGEEILPEDMTTLHIQNSINMINKICEKDGLEPTDYIIYNKLVAEIKSRQKM